MTDAHPQEQVVRGQAAIDLPAGCWDHVKMGSDDFTIAAYGIYDGRIVMFGVLKDQRRTIELSYPIVEVAISNVSSAVSMKEVKASMRAALDK